MTFFLWIIYYFCGVKEWNVEIFTKSDDLPEECGMNGVCSCYFVVEGDGGVYPCDFYCLDEWKLGTVEDSLHQLLQSEKAIQFIATSRCENEKCKKCSYFILCHGGCRIWRPLCWHRL